MSAATEAERVLTTGGEVALEVVRMGVNEQNPSLMPALYPGGLTTVSRPIGTLDVMWLAFETLAKINTRSINGETYFLLRASSAGVP